METGLMQPAWTSKNFLQQFTEWQQDLYRWELESGRKWDDGTKVSVVTRWAPMEYRRFFRSSPTSVTSSFSNLKEAIENYYHRGETYGTTGVASMFAEEQEPQPMELATREK